MNMKVSNGGFTYTACGMVDVPYSVPDIEFSVDLHDLLQLLKGLFFCFHLKMLIKPIVWF
jgi:hypothetical protein